MAQSSALGIVSRFGGRLVLLRVLDAVRQQRRGPCIQQCTLINTATSSSIYRQIDRTQMRSLTHRLVDGTNAQYVNYEDFRPYLKLELQYISNPNPNPICSFNDEDRAVPL